VKRQLPVLVLGLWFINGVGKKVNLNPTPLIGFINGVGKKEDVPVVKRELPVIV